MTWVLPIEILDGNVTLRQLSLTGAQNPGWGAMSDILRQLPECYGILEIPTLLQVKVDLQPQRLSRGSHESQQN